MHRPFLTIAAFLGALAVALGAFGAHSLKDHLQAVDPAHLRMGWWNTAAQYHLSHALALALCAATAGHGRLGRIACVCFVAGIALFSGTLYAMALSDLRVLGAVTPIGGLSLLVGWALFGLAVRRAPDSGEMRL